MARFKESMRGHVAGSMNDRFTVNHEKFTVNHPDGAPPARSSIERQGEGRRRLETACAIRLERIIPDPSQPRTEFDRESLSRLAESLKTRGQLQPIRVRWDESADRYVVVVGERRYRAATLAGFDTIACVVTASDAAPEDLLEDQLVENALREDLKPIEQAKAYQSLLTAKGLTQGRLAERLQIGQASIARAVALLDLPEPIRDAVERGAIAPNTGYELTKVKDPVEQEVLAREASEGRLGRDEIQRRTKSHPGKTSKGRGGKPAKTTQRVFRTAPGPKIIAEFKRGLDVELIRAALLDALAQLDASEDKVEAASRV